MIRTSLALLALCAPLLANAAQIEPAEINALSSVTRAAVNASDQARCRIAHHHTRHDTRGTTGKPAEPAKPSS